METPGSSTSQREVLWKTPNSVTAAVENFGQRRVFLERFRTASFFCRGAFSETRFRLILVCFCAGGARVSLGGARCAQVCFFIDFETILGSILGGIFEDVAFFSIHFRSVFSEASRHALVTISALFWEPFREHFWYVCGK